MTTSNIFLLLKQHYERLPQSEKKIADFILKNPEKVLHLSVQELSAASNSSSAAVMRLSKSMGFDGFSNFKFHLQQSLLNDEKNYSEIEPEDNPLSIGKKLYSRLVYSLEKTESSINETSYKSASKLLKEGKKIYLFGLGASSLVARDLFQKLSRIGLDIFFSEDYHLLSAAMANQKKNSVLISISNSGESYLANQITKVAKKLNFKIIVITSDEQSSLASHADIVLSTNTSEEFKLRSTATVSMVAQLFVVDTLFLTYASEDYQKSLRLLTYSKEITEIIDEL